MAPTDVAELRRELQSIDRCVEGLLQRQSELLSQIACLEAPSTNLNPLQEDAAGSSTWATVVRNKRRISLPLFPDPLDDDDHDDPLMLQNRFHPLRGLDEDVPLCSNSAASPQSLGVSSCGQRPIPHSPRSNTTTSTAPSTSRCLPPLLATEVPSNASRLASISSANLAVAARFTTPPKYILVGDSIIRHVAIPNTITYSYPGAKIRDIIQFIPALIERYSSAVAVVVHVGTNDISSRCRQSSQLQQDYELLANTIMEHGVDCIFSGLIPTLRRSSEKFSRLYSSDIWLKNFSSACGHGYIDNFNSFWRMDNLFKHDNLHPNNNGVTVLATNISCHLSTISDIE